MQTLPRPAYMAILEFRQDVPFPIPADSFDEAEYMAVCAAEDLPGLLRVAVYVWRGPEEEYVLLQTLGLRP